VSIAIYYNFCSSGTLKLIENIEFLTRMLYAHAEHMGQELMRALSIRVRMVRALSIRVRVLMRAQIAVHSTHAEHTHQELMRALRVRVRN
jgi:hypothetical protein